MKFFAILCALLLTLQLASATHPWEKTWAIRKCVKDRQCWTMGNTAVCGRNPRTHKTVGFPNRCYYACVNFNEGGRWTIDHWYNPSGRCLQYWSDRCSRC